MTSQKRNRYHESNSSSRFRDNIPPRFKRQKSSSSPPTPAEDTDNQENQCVATPAVFPESSFPCLGDTMTPLPANKADTERASPSDNLWQSDAARGSPHVLAQMDNFGNYSNPNWSSVTSVPYQSSSVFHSSPMYSWQPQHIAQPNPAIYQQRMLPGYFQQPLLARNDCVSPSLQMAQVKPMDSGLVIQTDGLRTVSPASSISSASPGLVPSRPDSQPAPTPDISDPDIRTIEMLRELERVADEKEKEDENDPTIDRKNLVSHHLRMLMCAVDRYTEGIDDDDAPSESSMSNTSERSPKNKTTQAHTSSSQSPARNMRNMSRQNRDFSPPQGDVSQQGDPVWQTVPSHNARKQSRGHHSPAPSSQSRTPPPMRTPPQAQSPLAFTPQTRHSINMATVPTPPMSGQQPGGVMSPFMQRRHTAHVQPLRAITRNPNDQGQADVVEPTPQVCGVSQTLPFSSPAPSPPLKTRSGGVWGPMSLDSPTDARSWDLWSGPSFHTQMYGQTTTMQSGMISPAANNFAFAPSLYPVEHCDPVDLREHMPLYRR